MLKINVSTQVLLIGTCDLSRRFSKTLEGGGGRGEGGGGGGEQYSCSLYSRELDYFHVFLTTLSNSIL